MKLTVTREAMEERLKTGMPWGAELVRNVVGSILTERDEAIRERDLAREMLVADQTHASCGVFEKNQQRKLDEAIREVEKYRKSAISTEIRNLNQELEVEKRRAAAFREVALRVLPVAEEPGRLSKDIRAMKERAIDSEAQKLLVDSRGEGKV